MLFAGLAQIGETLPVNAVVLSGVAAGSDILPLLSVAGQQSGCHCLRTIMTDNG